MKYILNEGLIMRITSFLVSAAIVATLAAPAMAADGDKEKVTKILNYARVTNSHKVLNKLKGNWKGTGSLINSEGGAAEKILCKSKNKMILGGRFLQQEMTCKGAGFSFDGVGHFGFDVLSKTYVGATMTTADSGISTLAGSKSGSTITFNISHNNVDIKKRVTSRATLKIENNSHSYEILAKDKSGKLKPIFTVKYTH